MKQLLALLFVVVSALGFGQVQDTFNDRLPSQPIILTAETPLEIQIVKNSWYDFYPEVYSIHDLIPALGSHVLAAAPNMVLAEPTYRILAEGNERRSLAAEEYVNHGSSIFDKGSIKPAEYILRCSFGGTGSTKSAGYGIRLGGTQVGLESEGGTSTAFARFELIRRRDFVVISVVTVKKTYSSTNIVGLNASRFSFFGRGQAAAFNQSSDGGYRRGLVSTAQVLDASQEAIRRLLGAVR